MFAEPAMKEKKVLLQRDNKTAKLPSSLYVSSLLAEEFARHLLQRMIYEL